jgi:hypothetical protein
MFQKQKTPNLLESFTWKEFKSRLNKSFMLHCVLFKDGMEFWEFAQGDGMGSLAYYVQDFNHMLIVAP